MTAALTGFKFEQDVLAALRESGRFASVESEVVMDGRQVDIVAEEPTEADPLLRRRRWFFEVKAHQRVGTQLIHAVASQARLLSETTPNAQFVLVVLGKLSSGARALAQSLGLMVWEWPELLLQLGLTKGIPSSISDGSTETPQIEDVRAGTLAQTLSEIAPGRADWPKYQQFCFDLVEHLFVPPLEPPRYESATAAGRDRRDLVLENSAQEGFWAQVRNDYSAQYVVVDAKNYAGKLPKRPVIDVAHYLKPYGCGMFALILSRKGAGPASAHAQREKWIGGGKLIVILNDDDVVEMLGLQERGLRPEETIRKVIADFRLSL